MTPLELLQSARVVVSVVVNSDQRPWEASVVEVIKQEEGEPIVSPILFNVTSMRDGDVPKLTLGEKQILFLKGDSGGVYQCLSYGKQGIWPKKSKEWPFNEKHVASFEDTSAAFKIIQKVLSDPTPVGNDLILADALADNNNLLTLLAEEVVTSRPLGEFLETRKTLGDIAKRSVKPLNSDAELLRRSAAFENSGLRDTDTPNLKKSNSSPGERSSNESYDKKNKIGASAEHNADTKSILWPVWTVILVAVTALFWLLFKRRK